MAFKELGICRGFWGLVLVLLLALTSLGVTPVEGIRCYICEGEDACNGGVIVETECPGGSDGSCAKVTRSKVGTVTTRSCGGGTVGCGDEYCFSNCKADLCNVGVSRAKSPQSIVFLLAGVAISALVSKLGLGFALGGI